MPVVKLETKVEGFLFDTQVWLEGIPITLSYDGIKTWTSTDMVNVTGNLDILFHAVGVSGTDWALTITKSEPTTKVIYQKTGKTKSNGHSAITDSAPIS